MDHDAGTAARFYDRTAAETVAAACAVGRHGYDLTGKAGASVMTRARIGHIAALDMQAGCPRSCNSSRVGQGGPLKV